jgi:hypothetical protein
MRNNFHPARPANLRPVNAPRQTHTQLLDQLALAGNAIQVADQKDAQQKLWVNRRPARLAVARLQLFAHKGKADPLFNEPQQMIFRNLIF